MRIIMTGNGRVHEGTPEEIVQQMIDRSHWGGPKTVPEYIRWTAANAEEFAGAGLPTLEEADLVSPEAYVRALIRVGYAEEG